jgi:hypothetical protein
VHSVAVTSAEPAVASLASAEPAPVLACQAVEYRKAPFLILVKALVQRICGVGQFLQGRPGLREGCGALTQALDRVVGRGSVAHRAPLVHPHLGQIARCLLEGRPILLLLGGEHQSRLQGGDSRLAECAQVLGVELSTLHHTVMAAHHAAHHAVTAAALLRIDERSSRNRERCGSDNDGFPHDTCPQVTPRWTLVQSHPRDASS